MSEELRQQLQAMLEKARRSLKAARRHWQEGDYDFASVRAYYAVFHVMQAALLTNELTFSKHAGVISGFAQHFLKPGGLPQGIQSSDCQAASRPRDRRLRLSAAARSGGDGAGPATGGGDY